MTRLLLSFAFLIVSTIGISQDSLFSKVYASAEHDYTIKAQSKDFYGNIAQVGQSNFNYATYTYLDSLGNVLFSKEYNWTNGPSTGLQFRAVKPTSDGNFIAIGDFFVPDQGANIGICAKIDSTGDLLWSAAVIPFNPVFFECTDVLESAENTFWITGQDVQSGEISILEIDQSGTQLQSYSFSNTGFRLENRAILELGTNQLALIGSQLDQSGNAKGHVLSLDKSGNILWSKIYDNVQFLAAQNDTNSIWIASSHAGKMAISTINHDDGSPVSVIDYDWFLDNTENIGFSRLKDSTLAYCNSSNFMCTLILTRANSPDAIFVNPMIKGVCISPSDHGGLYLGGNGPMYGVKSMNNLFDHSGLIRLDSSLTNGLCSFSPGPVTITNGTLTATTLSVNSTQASSVNTGSLGAIDQVLQSYTGCVDFYSGLNEMDANNLTIFPNPANDFIRLQFENANSGIIEILSMDGKLVQQTPVPGNVSISVGKLIAGTYLYQFTSSNSKNGISRGKLVIEN